MTINSGNNAEHHVENKLENVLTSKADVVEEIEVEVAGHEKFGRLGGRFYLCVFGSLWALAVTHC